MLKSHKKFEPLYRKVDGTFNRPATFTLQVAFFIALSVISVLSYIIYDIGCEDFATKVKPGAFIIRYNWHIPHRGIA